MSMLSVLMTSVSCILSYLCIYLLDSVYLSINLSKQDVVVSDEHA